MVDLGTRVSQITVPHPVGGSIVEGDEPTLVFGIHISSFFQEILHHIQMVVTTCMEGRGRETNVKYM